MTRSRQDRPYPARIIAPPRHTRDGDISPAWLLMQAAQLSWEIRSILQLINGLRLNLGEELQIHSEASDMLLNAAHATAIMEAQLPLAPAWSSGPPRSRSIFAQAREAGTDPADVRPDLHMLRPPINPHVSNDVDAALRDDPDPDAQCAGTTLKKDRCTKTIVTGIGSAHCSIHLTPAERQRRDQLRAAQDRRLRAIQDALDEQRIGLAARWADHYGRRPHRLELPSPPGRPRRPALVDDHVELAFAEDEQAMLALYDTGWPALCPRSAEIIDALLDWPRATITDVAIIATEQRPERWSSAEQWLESSIWDGIRPPALALPAAGQAPELDEHPAVQVLRRHLDDDHHAWQRWHTGFSALVEACDDPPLETMADLLAFWQDIGILTSHDSATNTLIWKVEKSPPSPWRVLYTRGHLVEPRLLATALDWLLANDTPQDPDLPPREVFHVILTSNAQPSPASDMVGSGATGMPS
ncbi:hypothetical protein GCM10022419_106080 [Nonomuraea rosea]|uniref:Uncharacterized protein n=2 Tax=Nonomuraea rosea TaxID=638574 RepID=A0ABP6ZBF4_9ACTN